MALLRGGPLRRVLIERIPTLSIGIAICSECREVTRAGLGFQIQAIEETDTAEILYRVICGACQK